MLGSVGQGNGEFTIDFNDRTLITSGNLSILNDFVKADITLAPTANFDFVTSGNATINFPDIGFSIEIPEVSLPFGVTIPGTSKQINLTNAYSGSYQLVFTNDDNLSNDYVWGGARVNPIPGIDFYLGLQVFFNAEFKKTDAPPILPEVGSFEVSENTPWIVLNAVWENSNSEVAVEIIAPDGTIFTEDTWDTDRFAIVEDFTTDTSRSVGILNPEPGIWDIRAVDETGLGVVDYSGFRNSETPTLAITDVVANDTGSEVTITYDALDADSDATLSFFYDADNQGFDGILIETNITEADGTSTYTWDTQGVAPGSYYIYASAFDGNNAPVQTYSVGTVEITEATATDVSVDKVASADTLEPGAALTYTITITNTGDIEAVGVSLTETLPEGATLISTSLTPDNQSENVLTFDIGNLASDASTTVEVTIAVPETVPESGFITSQSQISSLTFDTEISNDSAIITTTIVALDPELSISDVIELEGNDGTKTAILTVTLNRESNTQITVDYTTANGTATAGEDFTAKTGTLTFAPGQTEKTIVIDIIGDNRTESDETFTIALSNPSGATIADGQGTVTITTDDRDPVLEDFTLAGFEDQTVEFSVADFIDRFSDEDEDTLKEVRVITLPTTGELTLDGAAVAVNQLIPQAQLDKLRYTPAADANGIAVATIEVAAIDSRDGESATASVSINLTAVNDAPRFDLSATNLEKLVGTEETIANFATNISAGAEDESEQGLNFVVEVLTGEDIFSELPTLTATGELRYGLAQTAGTATLRVSLQDDGGTDNGGIDTSLVVSQQKDDGL